MSPEQNQPHPAQDKNHPARAHRYNPKREANTQFKNESTGLTDEGLGEETASSASGSVEKDEDDESSTRQDDSGAV